MKVIVLTRGDLTNTLGMFFRTNNLYKDIQLKGQGSAEAIVPDVVMNEPGRAERKDVFNI